MTRARDWQDRLDALIRARAAAPFAWGVNDCCTFACDAVVAITGNDPATGLRDHRTAAEAAAVLKAHGSVAALADARLGPPIHPGLAQVGDVGLGALDGRDTLLLCGGSTWHAPGPAGLVAVHADAITRAWRTG